MGDIRRWVEYGSQLYPIGPKDGKLWDLPQQNNISI